MSASIKNEDPDKLLNEWLGELENLIGGLEISSTAALIKPPSTNNNLSQNLNNSNINNNISNNQARLRPRSETSSERTNSYRFSMANLEETHESELDAILGELSLLEQRSNDLRQGRTHSRSNSTVSGATNSTISSSSESGTGSDTVLREPRTESPDNDSAFSDTVSLLSSESSASSGVSGGSAGVHMKNLQNSTSTGGLTSKIDSAKAAKIQLALQKLEHASVRRLFVKAFSADGASKSLLVDERMSCGHVTRLLADKNHVQMEPHWALVEHLTDFQMERLFEDHELLVDNLMTWSPDSKNRVLFLQRNDKIALFNTPEKFLPGTQMAPGSDHDEHTRAMLLDEFFNTNGQITMDGPLYMKNDSKKGWKRYHFVLRASGIYYFPKEKTRSPRDLICLTLFTGHEVYKGIGWKKKHKAPTDHTFALRSPNDSYNIKSCRSLKMLCAEDSETLEKWITAIRIAKHGKQIFDNYKALIDDLTREELDKFSSTRSNSIGSIISSVPSQCSSSSSNSSMNVPPSVSNGRLSRASSSSSSGCLSDDNNGFDSEFTTGTIKRKPSMKPNLPLTSMTRQLKEVGETTVGESSNPTSPDHGGTLTRRHSRRRSEESNGSGTLKRRQTTNRGSVESMNSSNASTPTPTPSAPGTPSVSSIQANQNSLLSPLEQMPTSMTDSTFSLPPPPPDDVDATLSGSTFSLDSLPPPPPPNELMNDLAGSQISLVSLPPPPPEVKPVFISNVIRPTLQPESPKDIRKISFSQTLPTSCTNNNKMKEIIPAPISKTMKPSALKAPPYKSPPAYNGIAPNVQTAPIVPPKTVSFADSPVLLRRKVCFEDQVQQLSPRKTLPAVGAPPPPPRSEGTRLSTTIVTSPRRLADSTSNPPRDFLRDLQRVMRKKWQVAQKCKLEPTTTPHEVLGFRDFNEELGNDHSSHYYRETANVSNWVQEHYGSTKSPPPPPLPPEAALYENVINHDTDMVVELYATTTPITIPSQIMPTISTIKKRPPPPPPKRSESTHLTHRL